MTMSSSKANSPDDLCGVCEITRENHGDSHHEFSLEGVLIAKKPGPTPRQQPPGKMSPVAQQMSQDLGINMSLRLVSRLIGKGLLDGEDLLYIFGGGTTENNRG